MLNLQFDIVLMTRISTNLPLIVRQFQCLDIGIVPRSNRIWRPQATQYRTVAVSGAKCCDWPKMSDAVMMRFYWLPVQKWQFSYTVPRMGDRRIIEEACQIHTTDRK